MKTLTIELDLEKGDTSMDDTVECRVNFPMDHIMMSLNMKMISTNNESC